MVFCLPTCLAGLKMFRWLLIKPCMRQEVATGMCSGEVGCTLMQRHLVVDLQGHVQSLMVSFKVASTRWPAIAYILHTAVQCRCAILKLLTWKPLLMLAGLWQPLQGLALPPVAPHGHPGTMDKQGLIQELSRLHCSNGRLSKLESLKKEAYKALDQEEVSWLTGETFANCCEDYCLVVLPCCLWQDWCIATSCF